MECARPEIGLLQTRRLVLYSNQCCVVVCRHTTLFSNSSRTLKPEQFPPFFVPHAASGAVCRASCRERAEITFCSGFTVTTHCALPSYRAALCSRPVISELYLVHSVSTANSSRSAHLRTQQGEIERVHYGCVTGFPRLNLLPCLHCFLCYLLELSNCTLLDALSPACIAVHSLTFSMLLFGWWLNLSWIAQSGSRSTLLEESVLFIPGVGLQLERGTARAVRSEVGAAEPSPPSSPISIDRHSRLFLDASSIRSVLLAEGVQGGVFRFQLKLLVEDAAGVRKVVLPFEMLRPRYTLLLQIYRGVHSALQPRLCCLEE
jgi:hypothetical protein